MILLAAVIIGGAFLFSGYRNTAGTHSVSLNQNINQAISIATTTSTLEQITYDDNWQQTLKKAASSSSWSTPGFGGNVVSSASNDNLSKTDILGRAILGEYAAAKQAGRDTSATNTQIIIAGQVLSDGTFIEAPKVYDKSSFTIISDNSKAALFKYGNDLGIIIARNNPKQKHNEITIVENALDSNDPSLLKEIDPIVAAYSNLLKELFTMKVPSVMADFHKNLINSMSELVFAEKGFTKVFSDGVVALESIPVFQNSFKDLTTSMNAIAHYFVLTGVTFSPNDPGAVFTIKSQ